MENPHGKERRRAERFSLLVRIECKTTRRFLVGFCDNVSETGLLLNTRETFALSTDVSVRFPLPPVSSGIVVHTDGIVVRADQGKYMGIHFTGMQSKYQSAIGRYIERNFD